MGMKVKPSKCRSFSIPSGKPSNVHFLIEGNIVPSIQEEEQKFLGRVLFYDGNSEECFNLLKKNIEELVRFSNRSCGSWVGNLGFGCALHSHFPWGWQHTSNCTTLYNYLAPAWPQ